MSVSDHDHKSDFAEKKQLFEKLNISYSTKFSKNLLIKGVSVF